MSATGFHLLSGFTQAGVAESVRAGVLDKLPTGQLAEQVVITSLGSTMSSESQIEPSAAESGYFREPLSHLSATRQ